MSIEIHEGHLPDQKYQERDAYLHFIQEHSFQFPKNESLTSFIDRFPNMPFSLSLEGFFFLKREQWGSEYGNVINLVAQVGEQMIDAQNHSRDIAVRNVNHPQVCRALEASLQDARALVDEYPLGEILKTAKRTFAWKQDVDGKWDIQLGTRSMRQIHEYAVLTSQKYDFEYDRYKANQANHESFLVGRLNDQTTQAFLEVSPSPMITPQAIKRGYLGNDTIFISRPNLETNEEVVEQYWFKASWSEIASQLTSMDIPLPQNASDVDILRTGRFITQEQLNKILVFLEKKRGAIVQQKTQIENYVNTELQSFLEGQLTPFLYAAATKLINGEDVSQELEIIVTTLAYSQNQLKAKITELIGYRTNYVKLAIENWKNLDVDPYARARFVKENKDNFVLLGCGVNTSKDTSIFGESDSFLKQIGLEDENSDRYGSLEFDCPSCNKKVTRPKGKLLSHCPHCKEEIAKC